MRRRFFLIYNPAAGTARVDVPAAVEQHLVAHGASVTRAAATSVEAALKEATAAAHSGTYDAIIAAGGDGTVRQAAIATLGTTCAVGAIMIGTGNVLAHELGLPRDPDGLAKMLLDGPTQSFELGRANGTPFLLMAGVGFDGRMVARLRSPLKQRIGKAAFAPAMLSALSAPLDRLTVEIDGVRHACTWAIVTNAQRYGGHFRLTQSTHLRTAGFAALLFQARKRADLLALTIALARGQLDQRAGHLYSGVSIHPCHQARIRAIPHAPVQIDGDRFGTTPLDISNDGGRVEMIVPAARTSY